LALRARRRLETNHRRPPRPTPPLADLLPQHRVAPPVTLPPEFLQQTDHGDLGITLQQRAQERLEALQPPPAAGLPGPRKVGMYAPLSRPCWCARTTRATRLRLIPNSRAMRRWAWPARQRRMISFSCEASFMLVSTPLDSSVTTCSAFERIFCGFKGAARERVR
jgi:hypothetical protein